MVPTIKEIKEKRVRVKCMGGCRKNYLAIPGSDYAKAGICESCGWDDAHRGAFRGQPIFQAIAAEYCVCEHAIERHTKQGQCLECDDCQAYKVDLAVAV